MTPFVYIMAAKVKCVLLQAVYFLIFSPNPLLVQFATSQTTQTSTTAGDTTASGATTESISSTVAPTTTTQVQTTQLVPTGTPTPISQNTNVGVCPCDLTESGCDVNCCCDNDCTDSDRQAFSGCLSSSISVDDRLCFKQELILIDNSPYVSNTSQAGLFCLEIDNYAARNYYSIPDVVADTETFNDYLDRYSGYTFMSPSTTQSTTTYADFYMEGDPIYTVYDSLVQGTLGLPRPLVTNQCVDDNPAAFLNDQTFECVRPITNLAQDCQSVPALDASTFYTGFKIVTTPLLFQRNFTNDTTTVTTTTVATTTAPTDTNETTAATVTTTVATAPSPEAIENLYNNSYTMEVTLAPSQWCKDAASGSFLPCNFTDVPLTPVYNSTVSACENTVIQVNYIVTQNGSEGITDVRAQFYFATVAASDLPLMQRYSVTFENYNQASAAVKRSGNPGYVVGEPVMAGVFVQDETGKQAIRLNEDRNTWMTIVRASATGDCSTDAADRVSVTFGQNMRSGCVIRPSSGNMTDYCSMRQAEIIRALEADVPAYDYNLRYVATFGNSDPETVGDWVPVLLQNRPTTQRPTVNQADMLSCNLVLGMHIQIVYASVGSQANPQPKILGVSFIYDDPQVITFRCVGTSCLPSAVGMSQVFEVSQSVSFLDISQSAVGIQGEAPIFLAKVPYDFFYPFLVAGAPSTCHNSILFSFLIMYITLHLQDAL